MGLYETLRAAAEKRLAFIRANEEKLVEAWLAETGLLPSESVLEVQNYADGRTVIRVTSTVTPRNFSRRLIDSLMRDRDLARRELRALEWLTLRGYPVGIEPGGTRVSASPEPSGDPWHSSWADCATALGWEG